MEPIKPSRGRARPRVTTNLPPEPTPGAPINPPPPTAAVRPLPPPGEAVNVAYVGMLGDLRDGGNGNGNGSGGNGNGNGGNGSGSSSGSPTSQRGSPNGNGNNGRGSRHARSPSDEDMPQVGQVQRLHEAPGFGRGIELLRTRADGFEKVGTTGAIHQFLANYFPLQIKKTVTFRLHFVVFTPEIDHIPKRKALLRIVEAAMGPFLFDGTQLFSTHELPEEHLSFMISFPDHPEDQWNVRIEFVRECDPLEPTVTQLYNVLMKKAQEKMELSLLGRYYFDSSARVDIPNHRLQLWPGFVTSMRQMEREVLLNVDLTWKVCRTEDVFTLMRTIRQDAQGDFKSQCEAAIIGSVVMTKYNKKTYKITGIQWETRPTNSFEVTRKNVTTSVTFLDYFAKKGMQLAPNQPMLVSSPTAREIRRGDTGDKILPPEICYQTGLNDDMRGNFRLMKDLSVHLHMQPQDRLRKTVQFIRQMNENAEIRNDMMRWGMRFNGHQPVDVQGRLLPPEDIVFQQARFPSNEKADWTMAFRSNMMLLCKPVRQWAILFTGKDADGIDNLVRTMNRVAGPLGFNLPNPHRVRMNQGSSSAFSDEIDKTVGQFQGKIDIIVIILPNNRLDVYATVKRACSLKYGIPSQCFLSKNVGNKGLMSICTKLVIQMNAKLGGQPWGLANPLKGLMVIGFDVHHGGGRSWGAMTATTSQNLASYYSTAICQQGGVEMAGEIGAAITKCLLAFRHCNSGSFPSRIMFYRDGVGEGQLRYVFNSEVQAIKGAIANLYGETEMPRFSMIIVTKRINTRLFLQIGGENRATNPAPGTVVDDRITCPEKYDFFLVPQCARQGTVSPVGFNVIYDESGLDADKMQRFAFKLCHGYFNWSGTVAVPAPCQYAHKLAFLTGTALNGDVNDRLLNNLHYL